MPPTKMGLAAVHDVGAGVRLASGVRVLGAAVAGRAVLGVAVGVVMTSARGRKWKMGPVSRVELKGQ